METATKTRKIITFAPTGPILDMIQKAVGQHKGKRTHGDVTWFIQDCIYTATKDRMPKIAQRYEVVREERRGNRR